MTYNLTHKRRPETNPGIDAQHYNAAQMDTCSI